MAHKLGKKVIAEGVEMQEQIDCLKALNCDFLQGFYYAKPMFVDELVDYLKSQNDSF